MLRWLRRSHWAIDAETTNFAIGPKKPAFSIALSLGGAADGIARYKNIFISINQCLIAAINNRVGVGGTAAIGGNGGVSP